MATLYRATEGETPWFGHSSFWTPLEHHARRYLAMPGFGGPVLFRADIDVNPKTLLDLRPDAWPVLGERFGLEREDYGEGELDHEIFWGLVPLFAAGGYEWVAFYSGPTADFEEWLHVGQVAHTAVRVEPVE